MADTRSSDARGRGGRGWKPITKNGLAALSLAVLIVVLGAIWTDGVRRLPDPLHEVKGLSWWLTPREDNAFMRMPAIEGDLHGIDAIDGGRVVWAVGSQGLIVGTDDGGRTWQRGVVVTDAEAPTASLERFPSAGRIVQRVLSGLIGHAVAGVPPGGLAIPPAQKAIPAQRSASSGALPAGAAASSPGPAPAAPTNLAISDSASVPRQTGSSAGLGAAPGTGRNRRVRVTLPTMRNRTSVRSSPPISRPRIPSSQADRQLEQRSAPAVPRFPPELYSVRLLGGGLGIAVGDGGVVLRTTDGGRIWHLIHSSTRAALHGLAVLGPHRLMAVGDRGTTLISADDGKTWRRVPNVPSSAALMAVAASGSNGVIIAAADGEVLTSDDGGRIWTERLPGLGKVVSAAAGFADAHSVFASLNSEVLHSVDGGRSWQRAEPGVLAMDRLSAIAFGDSRRGVALGSRLGRADGMVTADGGLTWSHIGLPVGVPLESAAASSTGIVYAAGARGTILRSTDFGQTWSVVADGELFRAVDFSSPRHGVLVGDAGLAWVTDDGGVHWSPSETGTREPLRAVSLAWGSSAAIAVGVGASVRVSGDGGVHWSASRLPDPQQVLEDVQFTGGSRAVALGSYLWVSADRGRTWVRRSDLLSNASALAIRKSGIGVVGGRTGFPLVALTADAGESWHRTLDPSIGTPPGQFVAVRRSDHSGAEREPAILGAAGLARDVDEKLTWHTRASGTIPGWQSLLAVAFRGARRGIAAGADGLIAMTDDGGAQWRTVRPRPTAFDIRSVQFLTDNHVVAIAAGRVLTSDNGGETWTDVSYHRYPSPWIWAASFVLLLAAIVVVAARAYPREEIDPVRKIANTAASDRPIGRRDRDANGLRAIALGVSAFLRNSRTEPPLTLAVTGEWGAGKSSLMNLLREDLRRFGFRPVWFNAWHHQSGENLLGSLLANIHAQAIRPG